MRLLKKVISGKPPSGFVDILPEDDEDLWHAYNLIHVGDFVTAGTFRKVGKVQKRCFTTRHIAWFTGRAGISQWLHQF